MTEFINDHRTFLLILTVAVAVAILFEGWRRERNAKAELARQKAERRRKAKKAEMEAVTSGEVSPRQGELARSLAPHWSAWPSLSAEQLEIAPLHVKARLDRAEPDGGYGLGMAAAVGHLKGSQPRYWSTEELAAAVQVHPDVLGEWLWLHWFNDPDPAVCRMVDGEDLVWWFHAAHAEQLGGPTRPAEMDWDGMEAAIAAVDAAALSRSIDELQAEDR